MTGRDIAYISEKKRMGAVWAEPIPKRVGMLYLIIHITVESVISNIVKRVVYNPRRYNVLTGY